MASKLFQRVEHISFGIAMCLNLLALYLILTKSRKHIGQYRKLLVIFLVTGIVFAILHVMVQPTCIVRENALITYGSGWLTDKKLVALYYGVVSMSFLIVAMQFIYRAMVLSNKSFVEINGKRIVIIMLILLSELTFWMFLCGGILRYHDDYAPTVARLTTDLTDFPTKNFQDRLVMYLGTVDNKLNLPVFFAIFSMIIICGGSLAAILWSSIRIIRVLNNKQLQSSSWRKHNYQLFIALYFQFIGPLLLLYIPCIAYLTLPFVPGHGFSSPSWILSLLYSFYPIVDPLVMIIFIRDYRVGLYNLLRRIVFLRPLDDSTIVISNHSKN